MADDEGASPRELVVEACRRDQPHLIEQVLRDMEEKPDEEVASFFNSVTDALDDVMDYLFDIQHFECDPLTRVDKDTPLHVAVRYANEKDRDVGLEMVKMMCEAGCDPRVKNKHGQKPADLVYEDKEMKTALQQVEYILAEGIKVDNAEEEGLDGDSASDSE